jgi:hypothetical protein
MKTILLLSCLIFQTVNGFAETPDSKKSTKVLNLFYILDKGWIPGDTYKWNTDDSPSYIQIVNNELVITYRLRKAELIYFGDVKDVKISEGEGGSRVTTFYTSGTERTVGKVASFELISWPDGDLEVHIFQKLSQFSRVFSAHRASSSEINGIKDYWAGY